MINVKFESDQFLIKYYKSIEIIVPTWNCANCNMPMTLAEQNTNVKCPNCGKKMIEVYD